MFRKSIPAPLWTTDPIVTRQPWLVRAQCQMKDFPESGERRKNTRLRELFEQAYELIAPFYDNEQTWGGQPLNGLAFHMLRDHMPELSEAEAHIIVIAAARAKRERSTR